MIAAPETGATTLDPPVASKAAAGPSLASWSDFLRLSVVVLPVKAYPAVSM
jgi:hypothetical protein